MKGTYTKTYMTKNGPVTKTYDRGEVNILTKKGSISKPFLKRVYKSLDYEPTDADQLYIESIAKDWVQRYEKRGLPVNLIKPRSISASFRSNRIEGMLVNTGFSIEEIAKQANTTEENLLDSERWAFTSVFSVYTNERGETYEFTFKYYGAVMRRI